MDQFRTFPEHARAAWKKLAFECQAKASIPEADLFLLQWQTLRDLANHLGFTDPAECAKIELVWLSKQNTNTNSSNNKISSSSLVPPAARVRSPNASFRAGGNTTTTTAADQLRKNSSNAASFRRQTSSQPAFNTTTMSSSRAKSPSVPIPSATVAVKTSRPTTPIHSTTGVRRTTSTATASSPTTPLRRQNSANVSPTASKTWVQQRNRSPSVTSSRYSSYSSASSFNNKDSTPPRERQMLAAKVCIEDLKPVFVAFASYGDDGMVDQIDLPRFLFMCRSCDLLDKMFRVRDAEAIFGSVAYRGKSASTTTKSGKAPVLFYHQFRMKVIPEVASKKQMSILELVKHIVRWGGPRYDKQSRQMAKGISVGGNSNTNTTTVQQQQQQVGEPSSHSSPSSRHNSTNRVRTMSGARSSSVASASSTTATQNQRRTTTTTGSSSSSPTRQFQPQQQARAGGSRTPSRRASSVLASSQQFEDVPPQTATATETPRRSVIGGGVISGRPNPNADDEL